MTMLPRRSPRQVVPRWRQWRTTALLGEARSLNTIDSTPAASGAKHVDRLLQEYLENPGSGRAAELLGGVLVFNERTPQVEAIARRHLDHSNPLVGELARKVLKGDEDAYIRGAYSVEETHSRHRIAALKQVLSREPRNVVRWVDLALEYVTLGQREHAKYAMRVARGLRPDDRFVLRSATALYAQTGEYDRAVRMLRSSSRTYEDPWLMASLIAVTDLAQGKLSGTRHALRLLDDDFPPSYVAELAAALGTWEIKAGSDRRGRQLLRASVTAPTENALAQAEWAGEKYGSFFFENVPQEVPRAFEASARREAAEGRWSAAADSAMCWLADQPFSSAAATYGSYITVETEDWASAEEFARRGLIANPGDPGLLNNRAYAYARQDLLGPAVDALTEARQSIKAKRGKAILTATEGLVLFRLGHPAEGRLRYRLVIEAFARAKLAEEQARAALNLAREEHLAGSEFAESAWQEAVAAADRADCAEIRSVRKSVEATRLTDPRGQLPVVVRLRALAQGLLEAPPLIDLQSESDDI